MRFIVINHYDGTVDVRLHPDTKATIKKTIVLTCVYGGSAAVIVSLFRSDRIPKIPTE